MRNAPDVASLTPLLKNSARPTKHEVDRQVEGRRNFLRTLLASGAFALSGCGPDKKIQSDHKTHHHDHHHHHGSHIVDPEVLEAHEVGFTKRNGPALLTAMQKDKGEKKGSPYLQDFVDSLEKSKLLVKRTELTIGCVEDRLNICRCGCVGSMIIAADENGEPAYMEPEAAAEMICSSDEFKKTNKLPIAFTTHARCGGGKMAHNIALKLGKTTEQDSERFVRWWGGQTSAAIQKRVAGQRKVSYEHIAEERVVPASGHPGRVLTMDEIDGHDIDVNYKGFPQSMEVDPALMSEKTFQLHVSAAIKILLYHGTNKREVLAVAFTSNFDAATQAQEKTRKALSRLTMSEQGRVLSGSVVVNVPGA